MILSRWALGTALLMLATMVAASLAGWAWLPSDLAIPMHYDAAGNPDRLGSLLEALITWPLVGLGMLALFLFLSRYEPRRTNLVQGRKALDWSLVGTMALAMVIHLATLAGAAGWNVPILLLANLALGMLFIIIGNFLPKTRSNFLIGVRTPWTLSSDYSWR